MEFVLPINSQEITEIDSMQEASGWIGTFTFIYGVLDKVLSSATGKSVEDIVHKYIFLPYYKKMKTAQLIETFIPGGNSNIYPPHSAQGATGYYTYGYKIIS